MKYISPIIYAVLVAVLIYLGNTSLNVGGSSLPPIMKFTNPFSGFWQNATSTATPDNEVIHLDGAKSEIKIVFDDRLVPHIFASSMEDALYAQGYLHAKYRLFQMDLSVRSAGGELSEILGERTLSADRMTRNMGMRTGAEASVKGWNKFPENLTLLEHYADGINAYISTLKAKDYPLEFKLLDYAPREWTILHSALFFKNMTRMLASGNADIGNTNSLKLLGFEKFNELYPDWNPHQSPIIPIHYSDMTQDVEAPVNPTSPMDLSGEYGFDPLPKFPPTIGSNNWAVSGAKTKSGNPILCNDPHLALTLPSIWYEMHIHTPETNVYGVSLPSMPGIIIGFNEDIAWGVTNVGHDVTDWYNMKWANADQTEYYYNGNTREVDYIYERIKVKGQPDHIDTIKNTIHGPIVRDDASWKDYRGLAMKWIAHDEPKVPEMSTFVHLNLAKNYDDFKKAISNYIAPAQNFVFASRAGDIAIHVNGLFPAREKNGGKFIKDGSLVDPDWLRMIPRDSVPHIANPERGFVSSANQHSTYPDYPYYYLGGFEDYRGRDINGQLYNMNNIEVKDMMALQYDDTSLKAADILPKLLTMANTVGDKYNELLATLKTWDYSYNHTLVAPTLFEEWLDEIYDNTFDEVLIYRDSFSVKYPDNWKLIDLINTDNDNIIFDKSSTATVIEKGNQIVLESLDSLYAFYTAAMNKNESLKWSDRDQRSVNHLAQLPAFSKKHLPVNGCGDVPNATYGNHGPSWRMIVDLQKDGIKAYGVFPGGQDGNPGSPYYDTGLTKWIEGEYFELFFPKTYEEATNQALFTMSIPASK